MMSVTALLSWRLNAASLFLGAGENSVRISPPLVVTAEQADIAMDVLEECIGIVEKENR